MYIRMPARHNNISTVKSKQEKGKKSHIIFKATIRISSQQNPHMSNIEFFKIQNTRNLLLNKVVFSPKLSIIRRTIQINGTDMISSGKDSHG